MTCRFKRMATLIKNQILKHLSKFTKNLSPDKLHLSTLKGHGELTNLELDEKVLTELLELPAWLNLTSATCNHVTLKIHWTKLKSVPISLSLDEVVVTVETCEDLRPPTPMKEQAYNTIGKYGFSDRVIDGMTVVVNSVIINFSSPTFQASFQLSRVILESYSPDWKRKDLRLSRIKDAERGELLLFKRLEWQVLRIEAKSRDNIANGIHSDIPLTPLRLITNQACCKITIKKKLNDCSVVSSRLVFILDDLLWVLTDAQLVAALHFLQSLSGLVQKATQLTQKQKAKKTLEQQPEHLQNTAKSNVKFSPIFSRHNVFETSHHVICSRIDLHLCDDLDPKDSRSQHPNLRNGGALQVSLHKLVADYYPYHRAFGSREHWLRYTEPSSSQNAWVQQLMNLFYEKLQTSGYAAFLPDSLWNKAESPKHASVCRVSSKSALNENNPAFPISNSEDRFSPSRKASIASNCSEASYSDSRKSHRKLSLQQNYRYLMSSCFILRLEDIVAYKVSTSTASRKQAIEKFLIYNRSIHKPSEIKALHLEHTAYYLPGDLDYPVPTPNLFCYVGPLKQFLDTSTVLWINAFYLNLQKHLTAMKMETSESVSLVSVRAEILMPQVIIPSDHKSPTQPDRPKTMQLQASRVLITNCRVGDHASKSHLNDCMTLLSSSNMFQKTEEFPWYSGDKVPISEVFYQHLIENDIDCVPSADFSALPRDMFKECTDIWSIYLDPFWAEFTVCEAGRTRLQSFVDPLPLTMWLHSSEESKNMNKLNNGTSYFGQIYSKTNPFVEAGNSKDSNINVLVHVHSLLNIQLTHFQYLFVLRAIDMLTDMLDHITLDTAAISKNKPIPSVCFSTWWPRIEVSLVLRSLNQMSATSDSVDLASLQDICSISSDVVQPKSKMLQSQSSFSVGESTNLFEKNCNRPKTIPGVINDDCCVDGSILKSNSDSLLAFHTSSSSQSLTIACELPTESTASDSFHKGLHTGTSVMKRGFSSLVASIDSALTKSEVPQAIDQDFVSFPEEDTLSLRSDMSYDQDQFLFVNQDGTLDDEFFPHPEVDVGIEAKEDTISNYTLNSEKKKEMISVALFKYSQVGFVMQSQNSSVYIVKCNNVETKEEAAISWENFQNVFSTRSRGWKIEKTNTSKEDSELSVRVIKDPVCEIVQKEQNPGFLSMLARNLYLRFFMSSISALVDFFEDEVGSKAMPSKIVLYNLHVQLQEDGLQSGLTPNSVPLNINIPCCVLDKTMDGVLSVLPLANVHSNSVEYLLRNSQYSNPGCTTKSLYSNCDTSVNNASPITKLLETDERSNDQDVTEMMSLREENKLLKDEIKNLTNIVNKENSREELAESKIQIRRLEEENRSLQDTLKFMQKELNRLEMRK